MAKLAPRRIAPKRTLKQLSHIDTASVAPTCKKCGERVYSLQDPLHICTSKSNNT